MKDSILVKLLPKKDKYRIAILANLRENSTRGLQVVSRKLAKGFIRNGHDVQVFSYLMQMNALSYMPGKKWNKKYFQNKTDCLCCEILKSYQPDFILMPGYRLISQSSIAKFKDILPNTFFAGFYYDQLEDMADDYVSTNKLMDAFMATGAGQPLATIAEKSGNIPAAFMPNPCDPDIERPYPDSHMPATEILFPGKFSHKDYCHDGNRELLLKLLAKDYGLAHYGNGINPSIWGMDYYGAISKTKIALSININNTYPMSHSNRLINYLSCGAFVVASRVPKTELLYEDHKHLRYFDSNEECVELIKYYLKNEQERNKIAAGGMAHAHKNFNSQRIAKDMVDFLATGTYDAPWKDTYNV